MKKAVFFAFLCFSVLLIITGCAQQPGTVSVNVNLPKNENTNSTPVVTNTNSINKQKLDKETEAPLSATSTPTQISVPANFKLSVAFASQAPLSNWDALHEEACEEASMIMAEKYFKNLPLTPQIMEDELQKLIKWETDNGYEIDLTAAEVAKIMNEEMGIKATIVDEVTVDRIKYEIYKGNLIIVPAAGRLLGNPNFTGAGPVYHMLLIKGYTDSQFITNDPGTRKGNGYVYDYSTLLNAVHDWVPYLAGADGKMSDVNMVRGEKTMIVVSRN